MLKHCPECESKIFVRNGFNRHGSQNHLCRDCGKQFVANPKTNKIPEETVSLVNSLLLERLSLAGICRVTGVSKSWILGYISTLYQTMPDDLCTALPPNTEGIMIARVEADELWSFVESKKNRQWVWLALDILTKQVITFHVGGRGSKNAEELWNSIPYEYQTQADFFTDMHDAYRGSIPEDRLFQVKKKRSHKSCRTL